MFLTTDESEGKTLSELCMTPPLPRAQNQIFTLVLLQNKCTLTTLLYKLIAKIGKADVFALLSQLVLHFFCEELCKNFWVNVFIC